MCLCAVREAVLYGCVCKYVVCDNGTLYSGVGACVGLGRTM